MWFIFCVCSVVLPLVPIVFYPHRRLRNAWVWPVLGFLAAGGACMDNLFTISRRCASGDFGGIQDTITAVLVICGAALIAAVVLGALCLALYYLAEKGGE